MTPTSIPIARHRLRAVTGGMRLDDLPLSSNIEDRRDEPEMLVSERPGNKVIDWIRGRR